MREAVLQRLRDQHARSAAIAAARCPEETRRLLAEAAAKFELPRTLRRASTMTATVRFGPRTAPPRCGPRRPPAIGRARPRARRSGRPSSRRISRRSRSPGSAGDPDPAGQALAREVPS
jgi:hypothetical protein